MSDAHCSQSPAIPRQNTAEILKLYEIELGNMRHYEALIAGATNWIVSASGVIIGVVFSSREFQIDKMWYIGFVPLILGLIGFLITFRYTDAIYFHWRAAFKFRGVLSKTDAKIGQKYGEVIAEYHQRFVIRPAFLKVQHEWLWQWIHVAVAAGGAAICIVGNFARL